MIMMEIDLIKIINELRAELSLNINIFFINIFNLKRNLFNDFSYFVEED